MISAMRMENKQQDKAENQERDWRELTRFGETLFSCVTVKTTKRKAYINLKEFKIRSSDLRPEPRLLCKTAFYEVIAIMPLLTRDFFF